MVNWCSSCFFFTHNKNGYLSRNLHPETNNSKMQQGERNPLFSFQVTLKECDTFDLRVLKSPADYMAAANSAETTEKIEACVKVWIKQIEQVRKCSPGHHYLYLMLKLASVLLAFLFCWTAYEQDMWESALSLFELSVTKQNTPMVWYNYNLTYKEKHTTRKSR